LNNRKPAYVSFGEKKTEKEFELLKEGKFQDKQLYEFIKVNKIERHPENGKPYFDVELTEKGYQITQKLKKKV
jgi:hypothetical protein